MPVVAQDQSQDSSSNAFRPGKKFIERRRQRRLLRQQEKHQTETDTANTNAQDRSIEVIRPNADGKVDSDRFEKDRKVSKEEDQASKDSNLRAEAPCLSWLNPLGKPKAVLLCVHGLGLHSGSYEKFGKAMSRRGYAVYAVDVRGFGSWMEAKGREKCDFKHCSNDIVSTLKVLRMANPEVPIFLLGESMGGAIALEVASENPSLMSGLISAVPAAERVKSKRTDMKVFLHLLTGNRKVNVEKSVVNRATADPALREEWAEDPLGKMNLSASELVQFQAFMNENHERAKKIDRLPVLIVQGGKDKLVKAEGTKELFEELATQDKIMALVNGAEHLVYEEGQFTPEVLDLTDKWIKKHLPSNQHINDQMVASPQLLRARELITSKRFSEAVPLLEDLTAAEPQNPEAFVMLGLAFMKVGRPLKARENVRKAFMIARSSRDPQTSRKANDLLLNLPTEIVGPILARQAARPGQRMPGLPPLPPLAGTFKVLIFVAKWCEPCKDLEPIIAEAKKRFGGKVEFSTIDVDEESNQSIVEQYHVSPIPTMIFLRPNGEVADYSVGFSGVSGMIKGIAKMLLPG